MASSQGSIWTPLPDVLEWTRVFTIQPGPPDTLISLLLFNIRTRKRGTYDCVSYTGGDGSRLREVSINGKLHMIRDNIWHFLNVRRQQHQLLPLWMDAISTNQNDPAEKGQQVSIIGKIFSGAVRTRIWLGQAANNSNAFMDAVTRSDILTYSNEIRAFRHPHFPPPRQFRGQRGSAVQMKTGDYVPYNMHIAYCALMMRPYWSRTWVMQEVVLSKYLVVHCGDQKVSWVQFWDFQTKAFEGINHWMVSFDCYVTACLLMERAFHGSRDLYRLMGNFGQTTHCADPRDRIYALMPLVTKTEMKKPLEVDYTIDIIELFFRTYEHCGRNFRSPRDMRSFLEFFDLQPSDVVQAVDERPGTMERMGMTHKDLAHFKFWMAPKQWRNMWGASLG